MKKVNKIKRFKVVQSYESTTNNNSIILKKGQRIVITEHSEDVSNWDNWVFCISEETKQEGWVPVQVLDINNNIGISTADYNANELTVCVDEIVEGYKELNGWIWAHKLDTKESDWIPLGNVVESNC